MKHRSNAVTKIGLAISLCLPFTAVQAQPSNPAGAAPASPGATAPAANTINAAALAEAAASANLTSSKVTSPPVAKTAGQSRRTGGDPVDDRVELRTYHFTNTDEDLPYAVFVSSKVTKDKKAPLVLALHGFGGNHGTFMRTGCVDEAEKNGYILVGVMGYSPSAPFGATMGGRGPGRRGGPSNQCAGHGGRNKSGGTRCAVVQPRRVVDAAVRRSVEQRKLTRPRFPRSARSTQ